MIAATPFTLIIPYYRNVAMLRRQIQEWQQYPRSVSVVLIDDGSPEPALDVVKSEAGSWMDILKVYRITVDIPWNRGGARNLGAKVAGTDWILQTDIDHILPVSAAAWILGTAFDPSRWFRFTRYRVGAADATRKKDRIKPGQTFGKIHPHVDSYLCTKQLFWSNGGYDEDYSGCLGGGTPFLQQLEKKVGAPILLPQHAMLLVHTRDSVPDASDLTLSRDSAEFSRRKRVKRLTGDTNAKNPIRFPWERVL